MIQTQENGEKPHFGPVLGPLGPNSGRLDFFLKNLGSSVPRYHSQLSSCTKSEKTNDRILRKLSDGRTYGRTDGRRVIFIERCPINVERPKISTVYSE